MAMMQLVINGEHAVSWSGGAREIADLERRVKQDAMRDRQSPADLAWAVVGWFAVAGLVPEGRGRKGQLRVLAYFGLSALTRRKDLPGKVRDYLPARCFIVSVTISIYPNIIATKERLPALPRPEWPKGAKPIQIDVNEILPDLDTVKPVGRA